ncbi:MAG: hypothetical protein GF320_13875 [Armatimonadia bacterium]|nr:hypothetical protein [Armatimonadia bacterium]
MRIALHVCSMLVLVTALAFVFGCAGGGPTEPGGDTTSRGTVSGTVVEDATETPVEGASVTLATNTSTKTATTDADGTFTMEDVLYGTYTVNVTYSPPGTALSGSASVTVNEDEPNPSVTIALKGTTGPPPPPF